MRLVYRQFVDAEDRMLAASADSLGRGRGAVTRVLPTSFST
jgi:hypothetical protein